MKRKTLIALAVASLFSASAVYAASTPTNMWEKTVIAVEDGAIPDQSRDNEDDLIRLPGQPMLAEGDEQKEEGSSNLIAEGDEQKEEGSSNLIAEGDEQKEEGSSNLIAEGDEQKEEGSSNLIAEGDEQKEGESTQLIA